MTGPDDPEVDDNDGDRAMVEALRRGDDSAFKALIGRYHASMLRVARGYVATKEAAEDVVQDTWLGVIRGIDSFEERSSLKTWLFRILVNRARTRGERESRTSPFSALASAGEEPAVDPSRFIDSGRWVGHWSSPPPQQSIPEQRVVAREAGTLLIDAIDRLPANQQIVISLRDVQGLGSIEVCEPLGITEANQRVLLHRARSKVRGALEQYLERSGT